MSSHNNSNWYIRNVLSLLDYFHVLLTLTRKGNKTMFIKGSCLSKLNQTNVKQMFVHRYTRDFKPSWANNPWKDGKPYPIQFASDEDWLENTYFRVTKKGNLDERSKHCESNPTWPDNPELR
jgi:hypothetical protein